MLKEILTRLAHWKTTVPGLAAFLVGLLTHFNFAPADLLQEVVSFALQIVSAAAGIALIFYKPNK